MLELDNYISIYGGAVRDSIADMEIHDVDIMCLPQSANKLNNFLKEKYDYLPIDLHKKGTLDLYKISNIRYMFINSNHIYSFKPNTFKAIKEGHKWRIQTNSTYTKLDWQTTFLEFNRNDNALTDAALIIHNF